MTRKRAHKMSLSETQALNTQLARNYEQFLEDSKAREQEKQDIADYELEISISTPYDEIDSAMSRFYPNVCGDPYRCLGADNEPDYYEEQELEQEYLKNHPVETRKMYTRQEIEASGIEWTNELGSLDEHPF